MINHLINILSQLENLAEALFDLVLQILKPFLYVLIMYLSLSTLNQELAIV